VDAERRPEPEREAREVLLAVLARDGAERPATHVRRDERAAAGSLARLVPEYLHAYAVHAEHAYGLRQSVLEVLGPDTGRETLSDGAWPPLAAALAAIGGAGGDVRAELARAAAQRELASADSIAEVLTWRLQPAVRTASASATAAGLPAGLPPPPRLNPSKNVAWQATTDPALPEWLDQRAERIRTRLDALEVSTRTQAPAWLHRLGPRPQDPRSAQRWDVVLRTVLAYRDEHGVDDDRDALGPRPDISGQQQRAWDNARSDVVRVARRSALAPPQAYDAPAASQRGPFLR
jgi:hypothetical protein